MKKLLLITLLLSGCAQTSDPVSNIGGETPCVYKGEIRQYLQNKVTAVSDITITYFNSKGTFESTGKLIFRDSIRVVVQSEERYSGYLFFDNIPFDSAFAHTKEMLSVNFSIKGDSLTGEIPLDRWGFKYKFNTKR